MNTSDTIRQEPVLIYGLGIPGALIAVGELVTNFTSFTTEQDNSITRFCAAVGVVAGAFVARSKVDRPA